MVPDLALFAAPHIPHFSTNFAPHAFRLTGTPASHLTPHSNIFPLIHWSSVVFAPILCIPYLLHNL